MMPQAPSGTTENKALQLQREVITGILFGLAGFALNWFKLELYFNVDFLFGSIISMFALLRYGLVTGVLAALIASTCTQLHWNHPWAVIIFTAEALCTGLLFTKKGWDTVVGNCAYWLTIGLLLVILFYMQIMGFPFTSTLLIAMKQGVNGIINTQLASALFIAISYRYRQPGKLPSLRQLIFVTLSLFVVIPSFLFLYLTIRHTLSYQLADNRATVKLSASSLQKGVSLWMQHNHEVVKYLAESGIPTASSITAAQRNLDTMRSASSEFKRLAIIDATGRSVAFSPAIDETGRSTIGIDLSDRNYIKELRSPPHNHVTRLIQGKIGNPGPRLIIASPILTAGRYQGAAFAAAEIDELKNLLQNSVKENNMQATLVDDKGLVVASTRTAGKPLSPFTLPTGGSVQRLDGGISHWIPDPRPGVGPAKRWLASLYLIEMPLESEPGWKIVVESTLKPTLVTIGKQTSAFLGGIAVLLLLLTYFSRLFSRRLAATVSHFAQQTSQIPALIRERRPINLPAPSTREIEELSETVLQMSSEMRQAYDSLNDLNSSLENVVSERTATLSGVMKELRIILEHAPIGIAKLVDRNQLWANSRHAEIFQYSNEELEGQSTRFLYPSDEAYEAFGTVAYPVLAQGLLFDTVQEMVRKDGVHIFVRFIGSAIDPADPAKGSIWLTEDITTQKQTNEELERAKVAAEAANQAKSAFLANMSHEIRTPMNGVIGMTQLLEMTPLSEEQRDYVQSLRISGTNLLALINDILDLSKIEAGRISPESFEFSLRTCIHDILMAQKPVIQGKGLSLQVDLAADLPEIVRGDQLRVRQIILNLLSNAIKFTPSGSISISVDLCERKGETVSVRIVICDTGIGIAPEALETIFSPFAQEDGSITRNYGGTGLGLTISRRLAELMGGGITVESTPETGSCFTVTIPFASADDTDVTEASSLPESVEWSGPRLRILLAEDNLVNSRLAVKLLEKMGHTVSLAANGQECLNLLAGEQFDLLLMDIQMPVMGGSEALRELRAKENETSGKLPVIALTAHAIYGDREQFIAEGFDGYVAKPLILDKLVREMEKVLEAKKSDTQP